MWTFIWDNSYLSQTHHVQNIYGAGNEVHREQQPLPWNVATKPIYRVEDEEIQDLMDKYSIRTVQDLANNIEYVSPILGEDAEASLAKQWPLH